MNDYKEFSKNTSNLKQQISEDITPEFKNIKVKRNRLSQQFIDALTPNYSKTGR